MAGTVDFTPSLEKIARAERKLRHVESILDGWVSTGITCNIRGEVHGERAHIIARTDDAPPEDVAWEIVEAVGHLRSALDKMLVALVEGSGHGVSGVGFPFGGVRADGQAEPFPTARHAFLEKKLTPEQWELIVAQKPYPGGNDLLWAVNELANQDKHRKDLVKVFPALAAHTMTVKNGVFISRDERPAFAIGGDPDFVCPDQERETLLCSYGFSPGSVHPQMDQAITIYVVFGPVRPVSRKEVMSTLGQQLRLIKGIVEAFRETF